VATIFAGFGIAPAIAAGFASTVYLITKFIVLVRNNPVKWGLIVSPVYFFTVAAVLTMSIVYKGAPDLNLDDLPQSTIALAIVLTGLVIAILSALFWLPFVHCTVVKKDYTLRWYHVFYGPLLWKRPAPEPIENSMAHVTDYRVHRRDNEHHETSDVPLSSPPSTAGGETETKADPEAEVHGHQGPTLSQRPKVPLDEVEKNEHKIEGFWWLPKNLWIIVRYKIIGLLLHGSGVDIHAMQADGDDKMAQRLARMHERSHQYANETEHLYSFLQVMTACTASFAHGSNDVSNAIGPFAAIYQVWNTGRASSSSTPTPTWMLAFGAGMIVVGLATYGYNIMAVLGNRLTMHSPSRGFSMELGASITVLLASQFAIPVSSTMCIVGATAGVGIVSNGFKAVNWRTFGWIFLGWVITVPAVSIAAGCLMGIILNAPRF
jgi:sodium-dependent phosphate transporter